MAEHTVLVVEDDPVILQLLHVNFSMEGWTVITATDGVEGLERARTDRPDAIVLDIMMPKLSGLEVLTALKEDEATAGIPIVLLSARAQASDVQNGIDAGADDYVTKPFEPLELLERVNKLVSNPAK